MSESEIEMGERMEMINEKEKSEKSKNKEIVNKMDNINANLNLLNNLLLRVEEEIKKDLTRKHQP